jgi:hypothetical protein
VCGHGKHDPWVDFNIHRWAALLTVNTNILKLISFSASKYDMAAGS